MNWILLYFSHNQSLEILIITAENHLFSKSAVEIKTVGSNGIHVCCQSYFSLNFRKVIYKITIENSEIKLSIYHLLFSYSDL